MDFKEKIRNSFPELPYGSKDYMAKMTTAMGINPHESFYLSFFVKNLRDTEGQVVEGMIKPRFIHFVASTYNEIDLLRDKVIHLFGDAFHYDYSAIAENVSTIKEKDSMDELYLHFRTRLMRAQEFLEYMDVTGIEEVMACLLKSTYIITVKKEEALANISSGYSASVHIMPSSAIFRDESKLLSMDMITAVERIVDSQIHSYDKVIDKTFDSVTVNMCGNIGEFAPKDTKDSLLEYLRKVIL